MKKTILLLLAFLPVLAFSQIKQPTKRPASPSVKRPSPQDSTLTIKGFYKYDTVKVRITAYALMNDSVETHFMTWLDGYVISWSFYPSTGQKATLQTAVFTRSWETIKQEDIYDVKQIDWK